MKTINYKGYQAQVEFDDGSLFVKVLHISDLLVAECDSATEAKAVAIDLIDSYLEDCKEIGKEPEKPFKGSFNIRISPEKHRRAAMAAANASMSLNSWVAKAIDEKLDCPQFTDRLDGFVRGSKAQIAKHFVQVSAQAFAQGSQPRADLRWESEEIDMNLAASYIQRRIHA